MNLIIHTDGGSRGNPGPAASAYILKDSAGNIRGKCGKYLGIATNNEAEYQAVILALEYVVENVFDLFKNNISPKCELQLFLDSTLVVQQLNGVFKVKNPKMREFVLRVRSLEQAIIEKTKKENISIPAITYNHISREKNKEADSLVNETLDNNFKGK